ncbi:MAG TPA: YceI family protein, partial [Vicinamibacterales bacterium]|nr:YceI family protein [Vicinamibacterales bacterium]
GKGEPPDDVPKVQAAMQGEKVLDSAHYPRITFKSTSAKGARDAASLRGTEAPGQNFDVTVTGTLTIRNVSQPVTTTVHVEKTAGSLTATGRFKIKQSAFGIQPISVAGVVAVKDELDIAFSIVAKP